MKSFFRNTLNYPPFHTMTITINIKIEISDGSIHQSPAALATEIAAALTRAASQVDNHPDPATDNDPMDTQDDVCPAHRPSAAWSNQRLQHFHAIAQPLEPHAMVYLLEGSHQRLLNCVRETCDTIFATNVPTLTRQQYKDLYCCMFNTRTSHSGRVPNQNSVLGINRQGMHESMQGYLGY